MLRRPEELVGHEASMDAPVGNCRRKTLCPVHCTDPDQRSTPENENIWAHREIHNP